MRFGPSFIERIRSHFLLSELIGKRIAIKKAGREWHALCPFHNEKTPSFTINDEKGFFHCFGCSAHGDSIEFVKRYERLTYPETIEYMAREAGIPLPAPTREETQKNQAEKTLYDVLDAAAQWFEKQLSDASGIMARSYLEKRGVKPETIRQFRIGYAPDGRHGLMDYLQVAGFPQALQVEAGLIIKPESGPAYDRFRGRVMFPIRNASGKVVAFGGRLIAEQSASATHKLPKYLNSPETPLFKKGEMLFNLDLAKRPAREIGIVVVMEGYMDVVMSAQSGIGYAVATLGTAVTEHHLRLLWQLAKEPVMCLDGDTAGKRAMMRGAQVALPFLRPGYALRFAVLPRGEDPDSYVQKNGKAAFEKILMTSRRLSQILWDTLSAQYRIDLPESRAALDDALKKIANEITDPAVRQHYSSYFRKQLWNGNGKNEQMARPLRSAHITHMVAQHHGVAIDLLIERLLRIALHFPSLLHKSQIEESLSRLDITSMPLNHLRYALLTAAHEGADGHDRETMFMSLAKQIPGGLPSSLLAEVMLGTVSPTETDALLHWQETMAAYEVAHLERELGVLQEAAGQNMDEASYQRLVEIKQAIQKAQTSRRFAPVEPDMA